MAKATWQGVVIAQSDTYEIVDGNIYFPKSALDMQYFKSSDHHTTCGWKGVASYYHVEAGGKLNQNAAWFYPEPKSAAAQIKDHVAFWKGVDVSA